MNPDVKDINDLLYKIEVDDKPDLDSEEWLLVIEALESYKELISNGN